MSQISAFSIQNCITRAFLILMSSLFLLYPGTQGFGEIAQAKYQIFLLLCGGYTALMLLLLADENGCDHFYHHAAKSAEISKWY